MKILEPKNLWYMRIVLILLFTATFAILFSEYTRAQYLTVDASQFGFDTSISHSQDYRFAAPSSIVIVLLQPPFDDFAVLDTDWYKGIHYYQVTRYKYPNISFHYMITEDGKLIQNESIVSDQVINYAGDDVGPNPIIVGHFVKKGSIKFNPITKSRAMKIITDLVNRNGLAQDAIFIKNAQFRENESRQLSFTLQEAYKTWELELESIKKEVEINYEPIVKQYSAQVVSLILPQEKVDVGQKINAQIKLKNIGQFGIYGGGESQILLTKGEESEQQSIFYNLESWVSPTQVLVMPENETLLPGEEKVFDFDLHAPLDKGTVTESFDLENVRGDVLEKNLIISLTLKDIEREVIEILSTDTGYLNVRQSPSFDGSEVTRVSPKERYFVLGRDGAWVKIQVDENIEGWVYAQHTKKFVAV
jgi:hypothetical protein